MTGDRLGRDADGGWSIAEHRNMIIAGSASVLIGSWIGSRILDKVTEDGLDILFKVVLTLLALRVIFTALTSCPALLGVRPQGALSS